MGITESVEYTERVGCSGKKEGIHPESGVRLWWVNTPV